MKDKKEIPMGKVVTTADVDALYSIPAPNVTLCSNMRHAASVDSPFNRAARECIAVVRKGEDIEEKRALKFDVQEEERVSFYAEIGRLLYSLHSLVEVVDPSTKAYINNAFVEAVKSGKRDANAR